MEHLCYGVITITTAMAIAVLQSMPLPIVQSVQFT